MANKHCNGKFFSIVDERYYRCMWDGSLMKVRWFGNLENAEMCPNCNRGIDAKDVGQAETFAQFTVFELSDGSAVVERGMRN